MMKRRKRECSFKHSNRNWNTRGLSPVIATVLLISMTLVLALIIFVWANSFIGERATKFDEPVENACDDINFEAEVVSNKINVINRGNVALWGLVVREKGFGSITDVEDFKGTTISSGETGSIPLPSGIDSNEIVVVPMILGDASDGNRKSYTCDDSYGQTIEM